MIMTMEHTVLIDRESWTTMTMWTTVLVDDDGRSDFLMDTDGKLLGSQMSGTNGEMVLSTTVLSVEL